MGSLGGHDDCTSALLELMGRLPGHVIALNDAAGRPTYVTPSVRASLGIEPSEFLEQIVDLIHPDDRATVEKTWIDLLEVPGSDAQITVRLRHADGTWRWIEALGVNALDHPTINGVLWNYRDATEQHQSEIELEASAERFRSMLEESYDLFLIVADDLTVQWASAGTFATMGYQPHEVSGTNVLEFVHPDDHRVATERLARALAGEPPDEPTVVRARHGDGRWIWVDVIGIDLRDNPLPGGFAMCLRDVTRRVEAERDAKRLLQIFEATEDQVGISGPTGQLLHVNAAARRHLGIDDGPLPEIDLLALFPEWETDRINHEVLPALRLEGSWSGDIDIVQPGTGEIEPVHAQFLAHCNDGGQLEHFSAVLRDISERKAFEARLEHAATHDPLTGLPNRTLLLDRLTMALARARRHETLAAVLFLDLDHFKVVNDSHGHSFGDELLAAIAKKLTAALRPEDTVARFGGDEFVVLCEELRNETQALVVGQRILNALEEVFVIGQTEIFVGASIGISYSRVAGPRVGVDQSPSTPETLLREADAAMYRAKDRGRNRMAVFDETLRSRNLWRLDTETALRRALERDELVVHYQPIVDLASGRVRELEALVRWNHPERGLLLPAEFVQLAEETGLIVPIGLWVLESSCRQLARWRSAFPELHQMSVAVNLSGRQLGDLSLADELDRILAETRVPPEHVVLEITESLLMDDVEFSHEMLARLKARRVRLAVDDFGTGYSSLSYLRTFPVDVLKVDRSFVADLGADRGDEAIVAAIIRLAHTLGLDAVAEGVEAQYQLDRLHALGCDLAQGFHLARPAPADEITPLLGRILVT